MIKLFLVLIIGAALGVAGYWYFTEGQYSGHRSASRSTHSGSVANPLSDRLGLEDIKNELNKTGTIVREKARQAGNTISDAAANAKITATIKAKLVADRDLPGFQLGVDTTDGVVTLSGKVTTVDAVARAVKIALDVDGVHKVYSTIQVVSEAKP